MISILDLLLVLLVALAAYVGGRHGVLRQACTMIAMVGSLLVTILIYSKVATLSGSSTTRSLLFAGLLLAIILACYSAALSIGIWVHERWHRHEWHGAKHWFDVIGGGLCAAATTCFLLWTIALMFGTANPTVAGKQVASSHILAGITKLLGRPAFVGDATRLLQLFAAPQAFVGSEPTFNSQETSIDQTYTALDKAITNSRSAVAKVSAWGCGATSQGTGFMVGPQLIITNAHVVAGAERISIQLAGNIYSVSPVLFDPELDAAVLKADAPLPATALALSRGTLAAGSIASVLGYANGGDLQPIDAPVLQLLNATGYDIYGQNQTRRNIYALRSTIVPGDSGSPLIASDGTVAGMVFGDSVSDEHIGYAIAANQLQSVISKSTTSGTVATGSCGAD